MTSSGGKSGGRLSASTQAAMFALKSGLADEVLALAQERDRVLGKNQKTLEERRATLERLRSQLSPDANQLLAGLPADQAELRQRQGELRGEQPRLMAQVQGTDKTPAPTDQLVRIKITEPRTLGQLIAELTRKADHLAATRVSRGQSYANWLAERGKDLVDPAALSVAQESAAALRSAPGDAEDRELATLTNWLFEAKRELDRVTEQRQQRLAQVTAELDAIEVAIIELGLAQAEPRFRQARATHNGAIAVPEGQLLAAITAFVQAEVSDQDAGAQVLRGLDVLAISGGTDEVRGLVEQVQAALRGGDIPQAIRLMPAIGYAIQRARQDDQQAAVNG